MSDKSKWRRQQNKDIYFRKAIDEGWRSRAVYKLKQINEKAQILKHGMTCIDLGSSPGSWSQFVSREMSGEVQIFAVDLIPMDKIQSVNFMQGDFTDEKFYSNLLKTIKNKDVDLVIEAVAENLEIKHTVYKNIIPHLKDSVIMSSNTSGIPLEDLITVLPENLKSRFLITHFLIHRATCDSLNWYKDQKPTKVFTKN